MPLPVFARSALLGVATGSRSQLPSAALALTAGPTEPAGSSLGARGGRWLGKSKVRNSVIVAAAGELVGDKLPKTPSRLQPPGLVLRVLLGAGGGAVLAQRHNESQRVHALIGATGALAGSFGGARYRTAMARVFGSDWPGAVIEDVLAAGLAFVSVR